MQDDRSFPWQAGRDREVGVPTSPVFGNPRPLPPPPSALPQPIVPSASPALKAVAARFAAADYLTATFDLNESGMVDLYETVVIPQWSRPFGALILSQILTIPRPAAPQVLDVACGPGYPTLDIARYLGQDADVAGIDIWDAAIQRAQRHATEDWMRNVTFMQGDFLHAHLPEHHFDLITCNLGYMSFADRGRALALMARLTRPGGWVILTTPLQTAFREFLDLYHAVLMDLQLLTSVDALLALVKGRPTVTTARAALERTGLVVDRADVEQHSLTFADARDFFTSPIIALSFLPGWRALVPELALRRLVFNELERRLNAQAEAAGRLTFAVPMLCLGARRVSA